MNYLQRSLLLVQMRQKCREEQGSSWQQLQRRDRQWFLQQQHQSRWELAAAWLAQWPSKRPALLTFLPFLLPLIGLLGGAMLMAGLLEFQQAQRINVFWWLLLCVGLPLGWWLISLLLMTTKQQNVWQQGIGQRLPADWLSPAELPLLRLTGIALSQQLSLWFAVGLLLAFLAYLALTDLVFGWSSTLDFSTEAVHRFTQWLALPWRELWPQAAPSMSLVENSRIFRLPAEASLPQDRSMLWWPFLLMSLLCFTLLPRLLSYAYFRWRLGTAHNRLFENDACLAGWWQRIHFEDVQQQSETVKQAEIPVLSDVAQPATEKTKAKETSSQTDSPWPPIDEVRCWGRWDDQTLDEVRRQLPENILTRPWHKADAETSPSKARHILLLCKGWEPPTGALKDYCNTAGPHVDSLYLWPVPLSGMKPERTAILRQSWQMVMPQLPPYCQILEPDIHA